MNLNEFFSSYQGKKHELLKEIAKNCGVSMMTAERWCRFYYKADQKYLPSIEKVTGIEQSELFNGF